VLRGGAMAVLWAWPLVANGQGYMTPARRLGTIDVTFDSSQILIKRRGQEWRIDFRNLVRGIDCASGPICPGSPTAPCPACAPSDPDLVGWDERHQTLYFALTTMAQSFERPFQIFSYSLATRRSSRLVNAWGAGFSLGTVSKNGRYFAFIKDHHLSPAGGCVVGRTAILHEIEIVDLWSRTIASPALDLPEDKIFFIHEMEWTSPTVLTCLARRHQEDCRIVAGEQGVRLRIDMNGLKFRPSWP
jgi:hypothetical protein